jgi:hypothetical protein
MYMCIYIFVYFIFSSNKLVGTYSSTIDVGVSDCRPVNFVIARVAQMVCKKDTRVYTGSGRMSLRPVRAACALALSLQ